MTRAKTSKSPRASEEERKERRRAANRRSAQKSRYREMVLMDELQKTVSELTKRNAVLKDENEAFRRDLALLKGIMQERKLRQSVVSRYERKMVSPLSSSTFLRALYTNSIGSIPDCHSTQESTATPLCRQPINTLTDGAIKAMQMIPRTPSPVESHFVLNPERGFPYEARIGHDASALLSADNLFHAVMATTAADTL